MTWQAKQLSDPNLIEALKSAEEHFLEQNSPDKDFSSNFSVTLKDGKNNFPFQFVVRKNKKGHVIFECIGEKIAEGAYASVHEVFTLSFTDSQKKQLRPEVRRDSSTDDKRSNRRVAKVFHKSVSDTSAQHEYDFAKRIPQLNVKSLSLNHPRIMIMHRFEQQSLLQHLDNLKRRQLISKVEYFERALDLIQEIAEQVNKLHNNYKILHRDLKLENILVDDDGSLTIADFDFADELVKENEQCSKGTPGYVQTDFIFLEESQRKRPRTVDIYALAVIILEILGAKRPADLISADDGLNEMQFAIQLILNQNNYFNLVKDDIFFPNENIKKALLDFIADLLKPARPDAAVVLNQLNKIIDDYRSVKTITNKNKQNLPNTSFLTSLVKQASAEKLQQQRMNTPSPELEKKGENESSIDESRNYSLK